MKPARPLHLILVFFLAVSLSSCSLYEDVDVIEVQNVDVKEFSKDIIAADIFLKIDNPNFYKIKLTESDIDLFMNGKKMGKLHLREPLELRKREVSVQALRMTADISDMSGDFLANTLMLLFAKSVELKAEGYVRGKAMGIGRKVKVDFKTNIATDEIKF